jgi:hypothetical protein
MRAQTSGNARPRSRMRRERALAGLAQTSPVATVDRICSTRHLVRFQAAGHATGVLLGKSDGVKDNPATRRGKIAQLGDWRGRMLSELRAVIKQADPDVVEEWKWAVPVWSHNGLICTGETYKKVVKMTFAKGAALEDPSGLFNSSLEGNTRRAIDFHEGEKIDKPALKALIRAAVALNESGTR